MIFIEYSHFPEDYAQTYLKMKTSAFIFFVLSLLCIANVSNAQEQFEIIPLMATVEPSPEPEGGAPYKVWAGIGMAILALLFLGLVIGVYFLIKKMKTPEDGNVEDVEKVPVPETAVPAPTES